MAAEDKGAARRAQMLAGTSWARDFSRPELRTIGQYLDHEKVGAGSLICREGEKSAFLCILVEGKAAVVKEARDRKRKVLAEIRKGQAFGEMSLFDGEPRSASVYADEETAVLVLTKDKLDRMIRENPALGAKLLLMLSKTLSQRLRLTNGKLVDHLL